MKKSQHSGLGLQKESLRRMNKVTELDDSQLARVGGGFSKRCPACGCSSCAVADFNELDAAAINTGGTELA